MPTALITGTSTGIGRETALHFARQGYRVFAGARKPAAVEKHPNIVAVKLDVDQDESVREAVDRVRQEAGAIDVLVNNAGVGFAGAVEYARNFSSSGSLCRSSHFAAEAKEVFGADLYNAPSLNARRKA